MVEEKHIVLVIDEFVKNFGLKQMILIGTNGVVKNIEISEEEE